MLDSILDWLRHHEGPLAYVVIGLASLIEYVFPPFPGDTIAVFAISLVFAAGYSATGVYAALVVGALVGGQAMWALGRSVGRRDGTAPGGRERPRFLRGPRASQALDRVQHHFEQDGALFLVVHRFVPALRSFVYVGAGMAGLSFWRVLVLGGLSAVLWNAALMAAGWLVADHWETLARYVGIYGVVALVVALAIGAGVYARRRSRSGS